MAAWILPTGSAGHGTEEEPVPGRGGGDVEIAGSGEAAGGSGAALESAYGMEREKPGGSDGSAPGVPGIATLERQSTAVFVGLPDTLCACTGAVV